MYIDLRVKYPLFLSDFNETWIFLTDFRKILNYHMSWKSAQWEPSCSMRTGGQTWRSLKPFLAIVPTRLNIKRCWSYPTTFHTLKVAGYIQQQCTWLNFIFFGSLKMFVLQKRKILKLRFFHTVTDYC